WHAQAGRGASARQPQDLGALLFGAGARPWGRPPASTPPWRWSAPSTTTPAWPTPTASTRSAPTYSNRPATAPAPDWRTNQPPAPRPTDPNRTTYDSGQPNCPHWNRKPGGTADGVVGGSSLTPTDFAGGEGTTDAGQQHPRADNPDRLETGHGPS